MKIEDVVKLMDLQWFASEDVANDDFGGDDGGRDNDSRDSDRDTDIDRDSSIDMDVDKGTDFDNADDDSSSGVDSDISEAGIYDFNSFVDDDKEINVDDPSNWVDERTLIDKITDVGRNTIDGLKEAGEALKTGFDQFTQEAPGFKQIRQAGETIGNEAKNIGQGIKEGMKEFVDSYPLTAGPKKVVETVKDDLKQAGSWVGGKIKEGYNKFNDRLDDLNRKLGNEVAGDNPNGDLYVNPNHTTGVVNWHARENPSMWGDSMRDFNLGLKDWSAMPRDVWDSFNEKDQIEIIKENGGKMPDIYDSREEYDAAMQERAAGVNPYLAKGNGDDDDDKEKGGNMGNGFIPGEKIAQQLEDIAKSHSQEYAKMDTDAFEDYMNREDFTLSIDDPRWSGIEDEGERAQAMLDAIEGEMALRSQLGGTLFGDKQAQKYKEAHPDALSYDDLNALRNAMKAKIDANKGVGALEKLAEVTISFFLPGASSAAENQRLLDAAFDPITVIEAAKENNISVEELLKMRRDIINLNNGEKAINYFKMTGDTLGNQRAEYYASMILTAAQGLGEGTMDERTAELLIEHAEKQAIENKNSDILNNSMMQALKNGVKQEAIGVAAGIAIGKGLSVLAKSKPAGKVVERIMTRVAEGRGTKFEQKIAESLVKNATELENAAHTKAMNDAYDKLFEKYFGTGTKKASMFDRLKARFRGEGPLDEFAKSIKAASKEEYLKDVRKFREALQVASNPEDAKMAARVFREAAEAHIPAEALDEFKQVVMANLDDAIDAANSAWRAEGRTFSRGELGLESVREAVSASRRAEAKNKPITERLDDYSNPFKHAVTGAELAPAVKAVEDIVAMSEANRAEDTSPITEKEKKEIENIIEESNTPAPAEENKKEVESWTPGEIDFKDVQTIEDDITPEDQYIDDEEIWAEVEKQNPGVLSKISKIAGYLAAASLNPVAVFFSLVRNLPDTLIKLGFTREELDALDKARQGEEHREKDYEDANNTENVDYSGYGKTDGLSGNKGDTANVQTVTSDEQAKQFKEYEDLKKAGRTAIRTNPYLRRFVASLRK